jgi:hypothetical protein
MGEGHKEYTETFGGETSNLTNWKNEVKMGVGKIVREDGMWMEVGQDRVQWRVLARTVLNLTVLPSQSSRLGIRVANFKILSLHVSGNTGDNHGNSGQCGLFSFVLPNKVMKSVFLLM